MKKIDPVKERRDSGYPTAEEAGITRRGLLRVVVAGGAAAAGTLILGEEGAARRLRGVKPRPTYRIAIKLAKPYRFPGCKSAIVEIVAFTRSYQTRGYLQKAGELRHLRRAILGVLNKHRCIDLTKPTRRAALQSKLATRLTQLYQKRTGERWGSVLRVRLPTR